ncbi:MAG: hypothetical protein PHT63_06530, partial [Bacteroidales bacterium]|nr:hypothetical protein [Bacteroidales bacterium]
MEKEKKMRNLVIGLGIVAVVLAGVLAWIWIDRNSMIGDLTVEKEQLTREMIDLKEDYSSLTTNNDSLNIQLEREKEKVEQLIDRVKKTEATNRVKMREYEAELGTLRSIMRGYIQQIDSLNTLTISLRKDAAQARDIARQSQQKYEQLQTTTDEYAKRVQIGSVVKGRGINLTAINSS